MNVIQAMGRYNEVRDLVSALERAVKDARERKDFDAQHVLSNALQTAKYERDTLHRKLSEVQL